MRNRNSNVKTVDSSLSRIQQDNPLMQLPVRWLTNYCLNVYPYIGERSRHSAKKLWSSIPAVYRQCATCYTDFWEAYPQVLPSKAVGKETGKTSYIERLNNTFRQRIGRLGRKTLSFSKKLKNHIGAVWYFIHHYNALLSA
jgi:insertion element IS1 protein InsB